MPDVTDREDGLFGRMNDPTGGGFIHGPCGDEMEFYLYIRDNIIEDVKYYTEGCGITRTCGRIAAEMAMGRTILSALAISPAAVIGGEERTPDGDWHCAILAVSTLYRVIADYLLKV